MLHELIEAVAPLADELVVGHALVDDGVQQRERERGVGAGTQREPQVGLRGGLGITRINHDDLQTLLLQVGVAVHAAERGGAGVEAPQDERASGAQIGLERRPAGNAGLGHEGGDPAQKRVVETVRRAEQVQEATAGEVIGARRSAGGGDGLGAAFRFDLVESIGNLLDGLIVRDLLPLALALLADALERMVDAGRMVHVQKRAGTTAAQTALARIIRITLDLDHVAILNIGEYAAVSMAEIAERLDHSDAILVDVDLG